MVVTCCNWWFLVVPLPAMVVPLRAQVAYVMAEPLRWLRLVEEHRATRTWAPNFAQLGVEISPRRSEAVGCWMRKGNIGPQETNED